MTAILESKQYKKPYSDRISKYGFKQYILQENFIRMRSTKIHTA